MKDQPSPTIPTWLIIVGLAIFVLASVTFSSASASQSEPTSPSKSDYCRSC